MVDSRLPHHHVIPEDGEQNALHVPGINVLVQIGHLELHRHLLAAAHTHALKQEIVSHQTFTLVITVSRFFLQALSVKAFHLIFGQNILLFSFYGRMILVKGARVG